MVSAHSGCPRDMDAPKWVAGGLPDTDRDRRQSLITIRSQPHLYRCNPRLSLSKVIARVLNGGVTRDDIAPCISFLSSSLPGLPSTLSRIRLGGGTAKERELYRALRSSGAPVNLKGPNRGRQSPGISHARPRRRGRLRPDVFWVPPGDAIHQRISVQTSVVRDPFCRRRMTLNHVRAPPRARLWVLRLRLQSPN